MVKGSSVGVHKIVDEVRKHLQALRALNLHVDNLENIVVHLLSNKIALLKSKEWENTLST